MVPELAHFPPHPEYGKGTYRRLLRFAGGPDAIAAQVDDTHHSFWALLTHDGSVITGIESGFLRAPTSACPGAGVGLQALTGSPLSATAREVLRMLPQTSNCTHLADLVCWALLHHKRTAAWAIAVPDEVDDRVDVTIERNGTEQMRWGIRNHQVTAPAPLAGNPLMRGFMDWAKETYDGDDLLAAIMLQRGIFVARGRQHLVDRGPLPMPLEKAKKMAGTCWAYSGERRASATCSLDYVEDFTAGVRPAPSPPAIAARFKEAQL